MVKKIIQTPRREGKTSIINRALRHVGVDLAGPGPDMTVYHRMMDEEIMRGLSTASEGPPAELNIESLRRARDMLSEWRVPDEGPLEASGFRQMYMERLQRDTLRREQDIFHRYCLTHIRTEIEELPDGACNVQLNLFDYHHHRFHIDARARSNANYVGHLYEENRERLTNHAYEHPPSREMVLRMIQRDGEFRHSESRRYGRSPAMQMMEDMVVYGRGFMGWGEDTRTKPEQEEKYPCVCAPANITSDCGRFTAELMQTNIRLWEESDAMRNCIYRSYRHKIKDGRYLAYHVSAPHLGFRSGFTFGFDTRGEERLQVKMIDRMTNEFIIRTEWRCEQIKGKANSRCDDRDLQEFGDEMARRLTKAYTRHERTEEISW